MGNDEGRIAHFRIVGQLGAGGMGVVWRAVDEKLQRAVALKVMRESGADSALKRARFIREARAAAAVSHANIATIYEVGESEGVAYIAMELVEGLSLRQVLQDGPLTVGEAVWIGQQIAVAAACAHERGIVHRDLKPANVMLTATGGIKVLDFGLAKELRPAEHGDADDDPKTAAGRVLGTPGYMAPEQAEGRPVDERADVFAIGATLYRALAGRAPFGGATRMQVVIQTARDPHPPLLELAPDVPHEVAAVVEDCLLKDAALRPTAAELCQRLASAAERFPMDPDAPTASLTASAALSYAPTRSTGPSLTATGGRSGIQSHAESQLITRDSGRTMLMAAGVSATLVALAGLGLWLAQRGGDSGGTEQRESDKNAGKSGSERGGDVDDVPGAPGWPLPPDCQQPKARAAYLAAIGALRAGDFEGYPGALLQAVKADPGCASAHLRLGRHYYTWQNFGLSRKHHKRATILKATLSRRDQQLHAAYSRLILRQPSDREGAADRMAEVARAYPRDPEVLWLHASVAKGAGRYEVAETQLKTAIAVDRTFAFAMGLWGHYEAYKGRFDEANRWLDRCLEEAPASMFCLLNKIWIASYHGRCKEVERWARQTIAAQPDRGMGHLELALALSAQGSNMARVEESIRMYFRAGGRTGEQADKARKASDADLWLEMLVGDFEGAETRLRGMLERVEGKLQRDVRAKPVMWLVRILEETGRLDEAAALAAGFMERRDAFEEDPRAEDYAMAKDAAPELIAVLRRAGKLDDAALEQARNAYIEHWQNKRLQPRMRPFLGMYAHLVPVNTAAEATAALAAVEEFGGMPQFAPLDLPPLYRGRALLLAGNAKDAVAPLEAAAKNCRVLPMPMRSTQAWRWYGDGLAAAGRAEDACSAYQVVLDRWGHAKPRSVTAQWAREQRSRLGCGGD